MAKCTQCGNDIENGRGHGWDCPTAGRVHDAGSTPLVSGAGRSPSHTGVIKRYLDLYRTARLLIGLGTTVKTVGVVLGAIVFIFWLVIGFLALSQTQPSSPFGPSPAAQSSIQTASFFVCLVIGTVFGALVGGLFFLLGVLISAQGELLTAHADSAVHTSPFLSNDQKAIAMSLSLEGASTESEAPHDSSVPQEFAARGLSSPW
jgi:hypothetical protein